jgi:hypothetical protein
MGDKEMSEKKKVSKKSLEYVRPQFGSFDLRAFPSVEFKFKKISIDDEMLVKEKFGQHSWEIVSKGTAEASELCRLYFLFLTDESKAYFKPEEIEELDYETNETKKVLINGPKKFMRSIDGGNMTEMLLIADAFVKTLIASRPMSDLPEEIKKNILEAAEKMKDKNLKAAIESPKEKDLEANA